MIQVRHPGSELKLEVLFIAFALILHIRKFVFHVTIPGSFFLVVFKGIFCGFSICVYIGIRDLAITTV